MLSDWKDGGQGRNRTADASLFRAALYHLSYLATRRSRRLWHFFAIGPDDSRGARKPASPGLYRMAIIAISYPLQNTDSHLRRLTQLSECGKRTSQGSIRRSHLVLDCRQSRG